MIICILQPLKSDYMCASTLRAYNLYTHSLKAIYFKQKSGPM